MGIKFQGYYKNPFNFEGEEVVACYYNYFTFREDGFVCWLSGFEAGSTPKGVEEDLILFHKVQLERDIPEMELGLYSIKDSILTARFWDGLDIYNTVGLGILRFNIYRFLVNSDGISLAENFHVRPNEGDSNECFYKESFAIHPEMYFVSF